jgi:hypothetical protein
MLEIVSSFLNNYKSKIRNPLMGTICSVWIIHNWRIVYALFNFDKDCTMQERINFIQDYFSNKEFSSEFLTIVTTSFAVIFITFILLALSRLLTDGYYKIVEPLIINLLDKTTIFTHLEKKNLDVKINELNSNIDRLRDANSKLENHNIVLLSRAEQKESEYTKDLLDLSEQSRKASDSFELSQTKSIPANKVIDYFDEVIGKFSESFQKDLLVFMEHENHITKNNYENFQAFKKEMVTLGILFFHDNAYTKTIIGTLFLKYYEKVRKGSKLKIFEKMD